MQRPFGVPVSIVDSTIISTVVSNSHRQHHLLPLPTVVITNRRYSLPTISIADHCDTANRRQHQASVLTIASASHASTFGFSHCQHRL
jgi:hypothetical protein